MQLDDTLITVRSRSNYELIDLTIILCRNFFSRYLVLALIGWTPWLLMDFLLLLPASGVSIQDIESIILFDQASLHLRFLFLFSILFVMQAPVAMMPLTFSLGQEMFRVRPTYTEAMRSYFSSPMLKVLSQGIKRNVFLSMILVGISVYSGDLYPFIEFFLLPICVFLPTMLVRSTRPFAPEILMLEQGDKSTAAKESFLERSRGYKRRMKSLHRLLTSELTVRFILGSAAVVILTSLAIGAILWFLQFVGPNLSWTWLHSLILVPTIYVLTSIFATVFRFVSYIDARILLEGWEVRVRFMSEAEKLKSY